LYKLEKTKDEPPKIPCRRAYELYAETRKGKFPEIYARVSMDPVVLEEKYVHRDTIMGSRVDIEVDIPKYVGRVAETVLGDDLIAALHTD
jgi:hypothetical protein